MSKLKQKLIDMKENAFCFVHLIADYVTHAIKGKNVLIPLEWHLRTCSKCAQEKKAFEESLDFSKNSEDDLDYLPAFASFKQEFAQTVESQEKTPSFQPGQIWSTPGFPDYLLYRYGIQEKILPYSLDPRPLLISRYDADTDTAVGFPVNFNYLEFASDFDLIVSAEETQLGFQFMIEVWNPLSTGSEFLKKYWGTVPDDIMEKLEVLEQEFNGIKIPKDIPEPIVTGKPIRFDNDIRHQFQHLERQVTEYISAPFTEKKEFEIFMSQHLSEKILTTMVVCTVVKIHRHKDFLRTAADDDDNTIYIFSKEQAIFNEEFILKISINERETEYLLQVQIIDNKTGEETRGFVVDIIEWEGDFPAEIETLKTSYLLLKKNGFGIKHIRLWERERRLSIPRGKNVILGIYKAGPPGQIEFIPIDLRSD